MKVIMLASQKGGVGKSTLCMCLYHSFMKYSSKLKLAIVDLDPQQSIKNLVSIKELDIDVYTQFEPKKLGAYSIVLVDTPPRLNSQQNEIYGQSDVILIPSKTGIFDVISTIQTIQIIDKSAPDVQKFVVLNQVTATTKLNSKVLSEFKKNNVEVLNTRIGNRLAFQHTMYDSGNIYDQSNKKASSEITELVTELYSTLI